MWKEKGTSHVTRKLIYGDGSQKSAPPPWEKGELRKVRPLYRTWTGGFSGLRGGYKPHLRIYNFSGHLVSLRKGK